MGVRGSGLRPPPHTPSLSLNINRNVRLGNFQMVLSEEISGSSSHLVKAPCGFSRSAASGVLCSVEDAKAQEIEAGTTIHGTFDELETMDVALDRSIAPGLLEGREEGGFVGG